MTLNFEALIDQIYEASVVPDAWHAVLDRLAEIADGVGTILFAVSPGKPRWLSSPVIHDRMDAWVKGPWGEKNSRAERLVPIQQPRFLTDLDAFTLEELENDEYYTKMLRPVGFGWCVGTSIRSPAEDTLVFSIEKAWKKGPVPRAVAERLDLLRPHLARAGLLSARFGLERARTSVASLDMIGLPAAAVTSDGRALVVNSSFVSGASGVRIGARDQVQFAAASTQTMFNEAVQGKPQSLSRTGRSIPVAGTATTPPLIAHVLPLRLGGLDVFSGAMSIVFLTPLTRNVSPPPELLKALFDLTPAEARIASMVIDGNSVDVIAKTNIVSVNTVRTQLKSIFAKTGVERQSELISLLGQHRGLPLMR